MNRCLNIIFFILMSLCCFTCTENIPDCPSKMCVLSGGWILKEAYVDDVKDNSDLSRYNLVLIQPQPNTGTTSLFNRIQPSGNTDEGAWSLINNESVLQLLPNDDVTLKEEWIIESYSPRKLVLVINRDTDVKQGPSTIRFVLEPF
jgi:hypothetical protein